MSSRRDSDFCASRAATSGTAAESTSRRAGTTEATMCAEAERNQKADERAELERRRAEEQEIASFLSRFTGVAHEHEGN